MRKGIICVLVAFALMLVASASYADIKSPTGQFALGARLLTDVAWYQKSKEQTTNGASDVGSWFVNLPAVSYLRARFYSVDKTVGGRVELGLLAKMPTASVLLRYAYGYWRIGSCRILAGQTDNWFGTLAYWAKQYVGVNEGHSLLLAYGYLWPNRVPQAQFTYNTDKWGVQFALEEPVQKSNYFATGTDTKFMFPRASLSFMFKTGGFMTHPGFQFVQHSYESGNSGSFDDSYNTWAIVVPIKFVSGPFTFKFQGHYGVNFAGEYFRYPVQWTRPYREQIVSGGIEDTKAWGGNATAEYNFGKVSVVGGFGYENFSNDAWSGKNGYSKDENVRWAAFISVPYQFTKNFGIHPEFNYYSDGDNPQTGASLGDGWILGVQFRFIF